MIRKNQIYQMNGADYFLLVAGKKGSKWLCKILTEKPGVYAGTHTMSEYVLKKRYTLCTTS